MTRKLVLSAAALFIAAALGAQTRISCIGDSITAGYKTDNPATDSYPMQLASIIGEGYTVSNFGVSGTTMLVNGDSPYWTKGRLGEALTSSPDIVFIALGTNDSKPQNAKLIENEFVDNAVCMIEAFRSLPTKPRVIIMTPIKSFTEGNSGISDEVCQKQICPAIYEAAKITGVEVLDMYPCVYEHPELVPDKVHPNTAGARLIAEKVAWYLQRYPEKPADFYTVDGMAPNPFITHMYTADPSARVWADGRLYVYASHDIAPPRGCDLMDKYHVFSTDDLIHWTDHGQILEAADVPWGREEGGFMWAPDCMYKDGTYYYYFPHPSETHTASSWKIGIATSDKPASDFKVGGWIKGMPSYIDPNVFMDDDGQAYIYNGGSGKCYGGKLKKNMVELKGKMKQMEGLYDFHEGVWVFKREGKYYMTYPDNYISPEDGKQYNRMHYAMGDSPLGPWEYKGIFLDVTDCDTSHGSVVQFKGDWYLFYHGCQLSQMGNLRSICVDRLYFNEDGTIRKVYQRNHSYKPRK